MSLEFSIRSSALPASAMVASFRGSQELSRPYLFDVYVIVPGDHEIEVEDAVGSRATLIADDGKGAPETIAGVFGAFELVRAMPEVSLYVARIVPLLWQLSLTKHSRVFTKTSIPDVIKAVLDDEGVIDYELRLANSYDTEEHVCQYRESSLDFIHRWMEREGLYYFFEQGEQGEKLVIVDSLAKHQSIPRGPVAYNPTSEGDFTGGHQFDNFTARAASLPAQVKFVDYDYTKPSLPVNGSAAVSPTGFGELNDSGSGSRFFTPGAGARHAKLRAEELRAEGATYHATGGVLGLAPGFKFTVERHPRNKLNKDYLATHVEHFAYVSGLAGAWGRLVPHDGDETYRVETTAISADQQYRHPSLTAWPRIDGYENAVIDGPATSEYAQIDDHGRYAIKFKFDEGTLKDGKASTYVRMMQPHAGAIEGWHFPQRKGTEVVLLFLGGDPDRPVIAGAIPNATTPSPVTSGNHTKNVIQTGGRNRLELEDQAGQQRITLSTPHSNTYLRMGSPNEDHEMILKTDKRGLWSTGVSTDFTIGNFWHITVGADKEETVTGPVTETYNDTKTEEVPNGLVKETYKAHDNTVDTDSVRHVEGKTDDFLKGPWTLENEALTKHELKAGYELTVTGGEMHTQVTGGEYWLEAHTGMKINTTGDKEETTSGKVDWKIEGALEIESDTWQSFKAPKVEFKVEGPKIVFIWGIETHTVLGEFTDIAAVHRTELNLLKTCHSLVSNEANELEEKLHVIKNSVKAVDSKVSTMKNDMGAMKNDMSTLDNRTSALESRMGNLKVKFFGLKVEG